MRKIVSLSDSIDHYLGLLSNKQEKNKADNPNCLWIKSYSLIDLKSDKDLSLFREKLGDIKYLECLKHVIYKKDIFHEPILVFKSLLRNPDMWSSSRLNLSDDDIPPCKILKKV